MDIAKAVRSRRGQNTVEYLLMLTVIVAVVLLAGGALKRYMPSLMDSVTKKISDTGDAMGR